MYLLQEITALAWGTGCVLIMGICGKGVYVYMHIISAHLVQVFEGNKQLLRVFVILSRKLRQKLVVLRL